MRPVREPSEKAASQPLTLHPSNGFIAGGGRRTIEVRCGLVLPGHQKYYVVVRNLSRATSSQQDHTLRVRVHGVHPNYLAFPDLRDGDELAFGLCHIRPSPESAHRLPLRVVNLQPAPRLLSATSSLAKQAGVFIDEACTIAALPAAPLRLDPKATAALWVCLQPHLSADVMSGGVCRQLVGGLRVQLHSDAGELLEEKPVKFSATFGRARLRVLSPKPVRFGAGDGSVRFGMLSSAQAAQPLHAKLRLGNTSELMPLEWAASAPVRRLGTFP